MDTLAAVLEGVRHPLVVVDGSARLQVANSAALPLVGATRGRPLVTSLRNAGVIAALERVLSGVPSTEVTVVLSVEGQDTVFRVTVTELPQGALLAFEDMSAFESAEQMRRDFVANVSHELRTPLTALAGFIETLKGAARHDPAARDRFLGIMEREAARMNRLVGDLLSLSRVESEERKRPSDEVELTQILRAVLASQQALAAQQGVSLSLSGAEQPVSLRGDADQLTQVFLNLVENAVKYGGAGGKVAVSLTPPVQDPLLRAQAVQVEVRDWGEGIEALHLPRLTERFYRVDSHRSREKGGTGLGLAIVKHIIARHRGRMRVDSQPGQGSRFTVVLPVA